MFDYNKGRYKMFTRSLKLLGAVMVMLGLSSTPALAERNLRLTFQISINHELGKNLSFFKEQVETQSKGALKIQLFDNAQLFKGEQVPQAVASGAIDMGMVFIDEFAGTVPLTGIFSVAFLFPDSKTLGKAVAFDSPARTLIEGQIEKTGVKLLWFQDYGPIHLITRRGAVRQPSDMKGKKTRVLGKPSGDFVEAVGGLPVKVSGSEQFLAYQRGTVDVGMTGTTGIKSRKIHEVMDSITLTSHAQTEFIVIINSKIWNSLSSQEKGWITKAARDAELKMRSETEKDNIEAEKWLEQNSKMKFVRLSDQELATWKKASEPAVNAFIKDTGDTGAKLVQAIRNMK
jgi:C4-dicarboxylate-binding protein DctP